MFPVVLHFFLLLPALSVLVIAGCANFRARIVRLAYKKSNTLLASSESEKSELLSKTQDTKSETQQIPPKSSGVLQKPQLNKPAPSFSTKAVVDGEFVDVSLTQYIGRYVVLFFYPRDFALVCPTEVIAFSDAVEEFKKHNTEILACSTGSVFQHLAWINQQRKIGGLGGVKMPLLGDTNHSIAESYGVLKEEGVAERATFIIDGKGILRQITVNDSSVGRNADDVLRLVQALQHVEKYGETCPADWIPGKEGIKKGHGKEYFTKNYA